MGNSSSSRLVGSSSGDSTRTSTAEDPTVPRPKPVREKSRHGQVHMTVALSPAAANRNRQPRSDVPEAHVITSRGCIVHGTQSEPMAIQRGVLPPLLPLAAAPACFALATEV